MLMLSQLLPGLRDLRAPLAAGWIWLVELLIVVSTRLPDDLSSAGSTSQRLARMIAPIGVTGTLATGAFLAYVLGIVSLEVTKRALAVYESWVQGDSLSTSGTSWPQLRAVLSAEAVSQVRKDPESVGRLFRTLSLDERASFVTSVQKIAALHAGAQPSGEGDRESSRLSAELGKASDLGAQCRAIQDLIAHLLHVDSTGANEAALKTVLPLAPHEAAAATQLRAYPQKLLLGVPLVYDQWDRLAAEADFRAAIAGPLMFLPIPGAVLATDMGWSVAVMPFVTLLSLPALAVSGIARAKRADARAVLVQAWRWNLLGDSSFAAIAKV